jgi:hypothetical protein
MIGLNLIFFDCLRISMSFQELSISSHCYCLITYVLYGCTAVQDQCSSFSTVLLEVPEYQLTMQYMAALYASVQLKACFHH